MIDPQLKLALVCFTATIGFGLVWNAVAFVWRKR